MGKTMNGKEAKFLEAEQLRNAYGILKTSSIVNVAHQLIL